ncbi:MAG: N-acetylneuraminate synthase family protein [Thalassobaculum sp.]|uniref:N-acetylneuraminate synthase family protein n=1 Tax=Thalassobaculum sp. TaxID=2022740 RepID=UPI0032F07DDF
MLRALEIGGRRVDDDSDCFVIAEIGHNHQGRLDQALELVDAAAACGASAVKLQKRDNRALFTAEMYDSIYNSENAFADTYGAHRDLLEFGRDEYVAMRERAEKHGLLFFSTAFDKPSADFLHDLDMPAYKIASGDLTNIPLITYIAGFGKPMIMSTGGGTMDDVRRAYHAVRPINPNFAILQCTSGYPPNFEELNLNVIKTFREEFPDVQIGLSSHDSGIAMALVGYVLGARIIEKHFTLNRAMKGTDHAFSLERQGLSKLVRDLKRARISMGDGVKRTYDSEKAPLKKMAKSLVASRDLPAGHVLTTEDVIAKSPGGHLPPYRLEDLLGVRLPAAMRRDEPFREEQIPANDIAAAAGGSAE